MLVEQIRQYKTNVLTEAQREQYFRDGFLILPNYVPQSWVARLQAALAELMDRSRTISKSDGVFILEEGATRPRTRAFTALPARRIDTPSSGNFSATP